MVLIETKEMQNHLVAVFRVPVPQTPVKQSPTQARGSSTYLNPGTKTASQWLLVVYTLISINAYVHNLMWDLKFHNDSMNIIKYCKYNCSTIYCHRSSNNIFIIIEALRTVNWYRVKFKPVFPGRVTYFRGSYFDIFPENIKYRQVYYVLSFCLAVNCPKPTLSSPILALFQRGSTTAPWCGGQTPNPRQFLPWTYE